MFFDTISSLFGVSIDTVKMGKSDDNHKGFVEKC